MPAGKTVKGDYFSTINVQCMEPDQIFFHRFGTGAVSVIQHIPSPMKSCLVCILANVGTEIKKKQISILSWLHKQNQMQPFFLVT